MPTKGEEASQRYREKRKICRYSIPAKVEQSRWIRFRVKGMGKGLEPFRPGRDIRVMSLFALQSKKPKLSNNRKGLTP